MRDPESGLLGRWSRRKALQQQEKGQPTRQDESEQEAELPEAQPEPVERPLTDADMPSLETLGEDDSYSGFLSPEVSEKLRKVALRKLFHGAGFNIRDGLDDYDEDFTVFQPLGDIVTADMRHREEMLERKSQEALAQQDGNSEESPIMAQDEQDEQDEQDGQDGQDGQPVAQSNEQADDLESQGQRVAHGQSEPESQEGKSDLSGPNEKTESTREWVSRHSEQGKSKHGKPA